MAPNSLGMDVTSAVLYNLSCDAGIILDFLYYIFLRRRFECAIKYRLHLCSMLPAPFQLRGCGSMYFIYWLAQYLVTRIVMRFGMAPKIAR